MSELLICALAISMGFVLAGISASFYQLVRNQPLKFEFDNDSVVLVVLNVLLRVVAGPFIVMRNAIRGALIENRPAYFLVLSTTIAAIWSFFCGVIVLDILISTTLG